MSSCNLDHSLEDVIKKLADQKSFIPETLYNLIHHSLSISTTQERLNEIFHLLKKYDLASIEERSVRNEKLKSII